MMRYGSPAAFRASLEARLLNQSREAGIDLGRLRRRVVFERLLTRLARNAGAAWVLKGGMALEIRLGDQARATRDLDLALRKVAPVGATDKWLKSVLVESLSARIRPSSRVKDLADLVLLIEEGLDADASLLGVARRVFARDGTHEVPAELEAPPESWRERYGDLAEELELLASTFDEALALLRDFWSRVLTSSPTAHKVPSPKP